MSEVVKDYNDIKVYGEHLKNKKIAFIVTGATDAHTAPAVIKELRKYSCDVYPYVTKDALRFVTEDSLEIAAENRVNTKLSNRKEHLGHDNKRFDGVVVYPATYNFIGKMAGGIADDAASVLVASYISGGNILVFPGMHGTMFDSNILYDNFAKLTNAGRVKIIDPVIEDGEAVVPDVQTTVANIVRAFYHQNIKGVKVLVTAGTTPVTIDKVRVITHTTSSELGIEIAKELFLRGADVKVLVSRLDIKPPSYIDYEVYRNHSEYKDLVVSYCNKYEYGIFSVDESSYEPLGVYSGRLSNKGALKNIEVIEIENAIDIVRYENPYMKVISFIYEDGNTVKELLDIARPRLDAGHMKVVANDTALNIGDNTKCFMCSINDCGLTHVEAMALGNANIAKMIVDTIRVDAVLSRV